MPALRSRCGHLQAEALRIRIVFVSKGLVQGDAHWMLWTLKVRSSRCFASKDEAQWRRAV
eukprot:14864-Heterococcus_DN1.PRE.1